MVGYNGMEMNEGIERFCSLLDMNYMDMSNVVERKYEYEEN